MDSLGFDGAFTHQIGVLDRGRGSSQMLGNLKKNCDLSDIAAVKRAKTGAGHLNDQAPGPSLLRSGK